MGSNPKRSYLYFGCYSFGQIAVIVHLVVIVILWITRDMGGSYGWSTLFKDKLVAFKR